MEDGESLILSSEDGKSEGNDLSSNPDFDENYFFSTLDSSLNSIVELEDAINQIKAQVLQTERNSDERKKLVKALVDLRLKYEDVKEMNTENDLAGVGDEEYRIVNKHQFVLQKETLLSKTAIRSLYCDKCSGSIWILLQNYYKCKACNYVSHANCLNEIARICQSLREPNFIFKICPEVGLAAQNYKCVECRLNFTLKNSWMEPRRCDYDGLYYCPFCHKNNTMALPARIIRNWDFQERKVSEASKQFLNLMAKRPIINLEQLNSRLFGFVQELSSVKRMREDIMIFKEFFMTCREANKQKLLWLLEERQHFVENSHMYSLQDLLDMTDDTLPKYIEKIHSRFLKHIKEECPTCKLKGFICEICENDNVIYPFDSATHNCPKCFAVFHVHCITKRENCPKCVRLSTRARAPLDK